MTNPVPTHAPKTDTPARPVKQPSGSWGGEVYLVRDVEDYVSRVESTLAAERASRVQADTEIGNIRVGLLECLSNMLEGGHYNATAIVENTIKQLDATLSKPSVSPEQGSVKTSTKGV